MKTIVVKLYQFSELNDKAKELAVKNHRSEVAKTDIKNNLEKDMKDGANATDKDISGFKNAIEIKREKVVAFPETEMEVTDNLINDEYYVGPYFKDIKEKLTEDRTIIVSYDGFDVYVKTKNPDNPLAETTSFLKGYLKAAIDYINKLAKQRKEHYADNKHVAFQLEYDDECKKLWFHSDGSDAEQCEIELLNLKEKKA